MKLKIDDNFGCRQLMKDIAPHTHFIEIRIRYDGDYYWFEGDWLKTVLPHLKFKRIEHDVSCNIADHLELKK